MVPLFNMFNLPAEYTPTSGSTQWLGVAIFAGVIVLEFLLSLRYDKELYTFRDSASSLTMGIVAYATAFFVTKLAALGAFVWVYEMCNPLQDYYGTGELVRVNFMGYLAFSQQWYVILICQLCDDFNYYWHHRFSHTIRFLWAAHIVHHSSDHYNMTTAVRNGWATLFYKPIWWLWVPAIGFHPLTVQTCLLIQAVWQFQLHTKFIKTLGPLDYIMNTHTMHQAHHAQNISYMDKNHGGYLNIFDKIFGTWCKLDKKVDIKYGVTNPPKSHNPIEVFGHEYANIWKDVRRSKSIKEAFMYIFGPPGWSPDGSSLTVRQLQRELKRLGKEHPEKSVNELEAILWEKTKTANKQPAQQLQPA